ncbi:phage holin family protein [Reyranella sp.]|uniref:phage holin family protein n=1 Tax=Reyranella sp. TaxID=1929291 RepID=UPI002720E67D|nr:phage holin family protein [Reyranella sp.]MDO8976589.1 phage holin family protein [Reyranella sp.]
MNTTERPGVVALVTDALGRSADLIQTEIRLARVELGEKADALKTSVVSGLVMMLIGTVFIIGAVILVLQALVAALIESGVSPTIAILIVAGGSAVGGIIVLLAGTKTIGAVDPTPTRTITSLQNDARMAKESLT